MWIRIPSNNIPKAQSYINKGHTKKHMWGFMVYYVDFQKAILLNTLMDHFLTNITSLISYTQVVLPIQK